jgi:dTDP-4-amino-4,6-dideoxy-D-galactose acyltransferase
MNPAPARGFRPLPWDSALFGFPVARISPDVVHGGLLEHAIGALRSEGVQLAYVSVPWSDADATAALTLVGAWCVDRKVRFRKEAITSRQPPPGIESVVGHPCTADLEQLALVSGTYSRFRADPRIAPEVFEKLYVAWMHRSMAGEIARDVLVIHEGSSCVGMVTVAESDGGSTGTIGLIAVADGHRGQGHGKRLMLGAEAWCAARGLTAMEVVTQMQNVAACGLYAACGYEIVGDEAVFHLWPECGQ